MDLHENITFEIFISDSLQASLTYKPSYWGEEKLLKKILNQKKKKIVLPLKVRGLLT